MMCSFVYTDTVPALTDGQYIALCMHCSVTRYKNDWFRFDKVLTKVRQLIARVQFLEGAHGINLTQA